MHIRLKLNGEARELAVRPGDLLMDVLRKEGCFGVKHGCETGECGNCAVLVDGTLRPTCVMLAAQADGRDVLTIEGLAPSTRLHPIQETFVECAALQCGFCTPAMVLAAKELLDANPAPTEAEVREALAGVLCRCTGYVKPVWAVLRAAAKLRGEEPPPLPWQAPGQPRTAPPPAAPPSGDAAVATLVQVLTEKEFSVVGKPEPKVDGVKLVSGKPAFTADREFRGLLYGKLLLSPVPYARIKRIDAARARALPGVHCVLTHHDLPRVTYTSAGQSWPEPGPRDMRSLDDTVRFVGDRVAAVAAESKEIAEQAIRLIEVEYEALTPVFDPAAAIQPGAPLVHQEEDKYGFAHYDFSRNLAAIIDAQVGDLEKGFAAADLVIEGTYTVPQVQQTPLETHVTLTHWDEDDRLVVITSTQVPFHVRRIIAPVIGLPMKRIRVIKPRIGGGFGVKQEVLIEDICAWLTIKTGRPVLLEYTREEEFYASRSRHPQTITLRTGVKKDGSITANEMVVLANTGAYGCHALTVQSNTGSKTLPIYRAGALRFHADVAYTNLPPAGAFRGYGVPQGFWALEIHTDRIARALGMDPMDFRLKNCLRVGDVNPLAAQLGEGREGYASVIASCGLPQCIEEGKKEIGWYEKRHEYRKQPQTGVKRRGVGGAIAMHGTAIPGLDMGGATIKLNDDGSFNLQVGATDIGTGADTVIAQIAAEVLGCPLEDIIIYSSDTDMTPFDTGAYASSTTYISGGATKKAAESVADQMRKVAAKMLNKEAPGAPPVHPEHIRLRDRRCWAPDGRSVSHQDVALHSLHVEDQHQIAATASQMSFDSPPPFAAQFAEVEVDMETGEVRVLKVVSMVDCGRAINPATAEGQIEGGAAQALGYGHCEEMVYDERGSLIPRRFGDYKIYAADEMPEMVSRLIETADPYGPFGAKAVAEIPIDGVAPAIANAVYDAAGVWVTEAPITPERLRRALRAAERRQAQAAD